MISEEKTMIDRNKFLALAAVLALSAGGLAACSGEREAEAETGVYEAEVKTEAPESMVSDQQLQNSADAAAAAAATGASATTTGGMAAPAGDMPATGAAAAGGAAAPAAGAATPAEPAH
ncbi:MAG: hypothetical protein KY449_11180 [Proteobacteria bacterium]|nr:hypothetical protein [Pseudomonadota bacterium]